MTVLAYIRRSVSEESPVSEEARRETVARLAQEQGQTIEHVFRDWRRSGGSEDPPQYLAMLERIERGSCEDDLRCTSVRTSQLRTFRWSSSTQCVRVCDEIVADIVNNTRHARWREPPWRSSVSTPVSR